MRWAVPVIVAVLFFYFFVAFGFTILFKNLKVALPNTGNNGIFF